MMPAQLPLEPNSNESFVEAFVNGKDALTKKEIEELVEERRKSVTQVVGSIVILLSVVVAFQQLNDTRVQSQKTIDATNQSTKLKDSADKFAKGFELLGKGSSAERSGGIRLLQQWVDEGSKGESNQDSPGDGSTPSQERRYNIFVPALLGLVRDQTKFKSGTVKSENCEIFTTYRPQSETIEGDVQLALNILIAQSGAVKDPFNFRGVNLSQAKLRGAVFNNSNFAYADLSEADLKDGSFRNSNFYCANLWRATLTGADFSGTNVEGPESTNMAGAILGEAELRGTDLSKVNLEGANLTRAFLNDVKMQGARLKRARFNRAEVSKIEVSAETITTEACLVRVRLNGGFPLSAFEGTKDWKSAVVAEHENAVAEHFPYCVDPYNSLAKVKAEQIRAVGFPRTNLTGSRTGIVMSGWRPFGNALLDDVSV